MNETEIQENLTNFYFLIYTSNPTKDTVKIWVDGNRLRLIMKRDKFYQIIENILGYEMSAVVHSTCTTYGCFYELDRANLSIKKLHPSAVHKHLNPSKDFLDKNEEMQKNKNDLTGQYLGSLSDWMTKGIDNSPYIGKKYKNTNMEENRLN